MVMIMIMDLVIKTFAHKACAKNCSHTPKMLITPLIKRVLEGSWLTKNAVLGQIAMRIKMLFWEQILEACKFIVGSSFQSSIISNNICH